MSKASRRTDAGAEPRIERLQSWIAALLSALLHALLLLLVILAPPVTVTTPQGTAGGSRTEVTFIDEAHESPQPTYTPPASTAAARPPAEASPAASRIQSTRVTQADDPVPPDERPGEPASAPPDVSDEAEQSEAQAASAGPPPAAQRRSRTWGQPPGMLQEDVAPANAGLAMSPAIDRGRRNDASSAEPNMEVGGYQVYYDLVSEIRLRAWRDQGMTELFLPLPGTRRLMVCPLEIALNRDSGACRLVEPDAPELAAIGDARDVINMQRVYRLGEVVWRGPGPYR